MKDKHARLAFVVVVVVLLLVFLFSLQQTQNKTPIHLSNGQFAVIFLPFFFAHIMKLECTIVGYRLAEFVYGSI